METNFTAAVVCVAVVVVVRGTIPVKVVLAEEQAPVNKVKTINTAVIRQQLISPAGVLFITIILRFPQPIRGRKSVKFKNTEPNILNIIIHQAD
jgi:hypothetical protein